MEESKIYYRRNLPHYQPPNATYFITFRLAGSLPTKIIITLKEEYSAAEKRLQSIVDPTVKARELGNHRKRYFGKFDELLDKYSHGPMWLRDERIAKIVADAIHYRDGRTYELIAYCIMPNHVHLVFSVERFAESPKQGARDGVSRYIVTDIISSLKKHTAIEANKALKRKGAFWQHESYDHVVRNEKELNKIVWYVLNNPVKAGIAIEWKSWRWSFSEYDVEG